MSVEDGWPRTPDAASVAMSTAVRMGRRSYLMSSSALTIPSMEAASIVAAPGMPARAA